MNDYFWLAETSFGDCANDSNTWYTIGYFRSKEAAKTQCLLHAKEMVIDTPWRYVNDGYESISARYSKGGECYMQRYIVTRAYFGD